MLETSSLVRFEAWGLKLANGREAFLAEHAYPFLVFEAYEVPPPDAPKSTDFTATGRVDPNRIFRRRAATGLVKRPRANDHHGLVTFGRHASNDIYLPSPSVSNFHAWFVRRPNGQVLIGDARSQGGTFVGGERLEGRKPKVLADGDWIKFGEGVVARLVSAREFVGMVEKFATR